MSATWKTMPYFALSLPNRPGELAAVVEQLRDAGLDLLGMWGYAPGQDQPRLSCAPQDPAAFRDFAREAGYELEEGQALYHSGPSQPGALVETLRRVAQAGLNLDAIEAVGSGEQFGCFIWAAGSDWDALEKLLT